MNEILTTAQSVLATTPEYAFFAAGLTFIVGMARGNMFLMAMGTLVGFLTYLFFGG